MTDGERNEGPAPRPLPLHKLIGYEPHAPNEVCEEIDSAICAEAVCECCGMVGMEYHPFTHPRIRSYRAYAGCARCGNAEEI